MSVLLDVLSQRKTGGIVPFSNQEIIGIEIRRKRLELAITLSGLCFDICSPSYLCKIERNQIQANSFILKEICERVSITEEQQDLLFNSYEVLLKSVKAFLKGDILTINSFVEKGKGFENYRYRIIQFMKYIYDKEFFLAKNIFNELVKLLSSMQNMDMYIFSIFSAILYYKEKNYIEAIEILDKMNGIPLDLDLSILYSKYLFLTSAMLLREDTVFYYHETIRKLNMVGYYDYLEEINYDLGIYALKTKSEYMLKYALNLLHNEVYINSLNMLNAYRNMDLDELNEYKNKPLNDFCKYLFEILEGNEGKKEVIMHLSSYNDDFDFNSNLLKYLSITDPLLKREFIFEQMAYYKKVKDSFMIQLFIKELLRFNIQKPHNKETLTTLYEFILKNEKN